MEIVMPKMGESVNEGTIIKWYKPFTRYKCTAITWPTYSMYDFILSHAFS